ncbi:MAG TPA: four helix bundle protein [Bacteroidales bacterium]|jgi:four helix bundle protein|nr:four helix bundle protein [Bacteroidales bacterium]
MKINQFEDIVAWQKSKVLAVEIYSQFRSLNDYGFKDQICRASVSVMNNIAEGFERRSDQDFKKFLYISKGSCGEIRSMRHLAKELNYISPEIHKNFLNKSTEISKLISGLIKSLAS